MNFERARNEENKKIRLDQIKAAAISLFDVMSYHEISLSKIGKEINFTRANLYKYISSKEDIFLYILIDEIDELLAHMEKTLVFDYPKETKVFALTWAQTLEKHPRYLKLFSLLFTILEQNANIETLIEFKNYLATANSRIIHIFTLNFPEFDIHDISKLLDMSYSLIIARYPLCHPSEAQIEACHRSNYDYTFPNFIDSFAESLTLIINGMKLSKMYSS